MLDNSNGIKNQGSTEVMPSAVFLEAYGVKEKAPQNAPGEQSLIFKLAVAEAVYDQSNLQAGMDREYGKPSPARQSFNAAFAEFRRLQDTHSEKDAFAKVKDKMNEAIDDADEYSEKSQSAFYENVAPEFRDNAGKPNKEVIDKLQLLSSALQQVTPGTRENLMRDLTKGNLEKLNEFEDVKTAYEEVNKQFGGNGVNGLMKSWFDYRAGLGDSIGQRQVFIGLLNRFDNANDVSRHEQKIQEFKDRIGGKYLY